MKTKCISHSILYTNFLKARVMLTPKHFWKGRMLNKPIWLYRLWWVYIIYRSLTSPSYLADEFTRVSEIVSRRNLRSASTANLVVPRFQRKTLGGRAFPVAAAHAWNSLPSHVTSSSSLASFKCLETELFLRSYVQAWHRLMLHVTFLTLLRALEVNIDLRHVNHIRYYLLLSNVCFLGHIL